MDFVVVKNIGVISESKNGNTKEINIVKWGSGEPKYDIRTWQDERKKPLKGITLTKDELVVLRNAIDLALDGTKS